jgi:RimJ/RimL family protein N-acetyltransferase
VDPQDGEPRVRLRPATVDDAALLELWRSLEYLGEFNDFGLGERPLTESQAKELGAAQGKTLIVEVMATGEPVGSVSGRAVRYGPNPESVAWNIGINLIPAARGRGFGGEAQMLLARHLLATTAAHRIEAMTDVDNLAEQRALDKAGFHREGVLKGAQFRAGAWHDLVVYALVRVAG